IEREHLPGQADADVPGRVVGVPNAGLEWRAHSTRSGNTRAVERIAPAEELLARFTRHVPADRAPQLPGVWRGELRRARHVVARGTGVQDVRCPVVVPADCPLRVDRPRALRIDLVEAPIALSHGTVR